MANFFIKQKTAQKYQVNGRQRQHVKLWRFYFLEYNAFNYKFLFETHELINYIKFESILYKQKKTFEQEALVLVIY